MFQASWLEIKFLECHRRSWVLWCNLNHKKKVTDTKYTDFKEAEHIHALWTSVSTWRFLVTGGLQLLCVLWAPKCSAFVVLKLAFGAIPLKIAMFFTDVPEASPELRKISLIWELNLHYLSYLLYV